MLLFFLVMVSINQPYPLMSSHKPERRRAPRLATHQRAITRSRLASGVLQNPILTRFNGYRWNQNGSVVSRSRTTNGSLTSNEILPSTVIQNSTDSTQQPLASNTSRTLKPLMLRRVSEEHERWLKKTPEIQEWLSYLERSDLDQANIICLACGYTAPMSADCLNLLMDRGVGSTRIAEGTLCRPCIQAKETLDYVTPRMFKMTPPPGLS